MPIVPAANLAAQVRNLVLTVIYVQDYLQISFAASSTLPYCTSSSSSASLLAILEGVLPKPNLANHTPFGATHLRSVVQTEFAYVCRLERRRERLSAGQPGPLRRVRDSGGRNEQGHGLYSLYGRKFLGMWRYALDSIVGTSDSSLNRSLIMQLSVAIGTCLQ